MRGLRQGEFPSHTRQFFHTSHSPVAAIELREVSKRFGDVLANDRVNLRVARGTIHGIVGENGAGKSTAMNILYGMYRPDAGTVLVDEQPHVWKSPADALAQGIGMVHQHFMLAGRRSVLDNIILGAEPTRWRIIQRREARRTLEELARQYGLAVGWDRPVEELPVGLQQRVEILKLLFRRARILILDEPTGVLTPQETRSLFSNLKRLRDEGKTILLVTHKLKEIMAFTERVTVFRAGKVMGELETAQTNPQMLADLMVGRKVLLDVHVPEAKPRAEMAIRVSNLSLAGKAKNRNRLSDISFGVHCGEIVGIAGVEGNGQSELLQALLHPNEPECRSAGRVEVLGKDVTGWAAGKIRQLGVAIVPQDRLQEGLLPERPVSENFLLGLQRDVGFARAGWTRWKELRAAAAQSLERYDVRPRALGTPARNLSGGNQQKLIVAREFQRNPRLLVAAQPTRGVDVGAIEFIHGQLVVARDNGSGVLLVSSELEEILALSDRILVMFEGRIVAEYKRGQVTEGELGLKMGGG
jgi:simple sugar transport system ATP-binding protein